MSPAMPNDPKSTVEPAAAVPASASPKLAANPGHPLPSRFGPLGGGKPMPPSRVTPARNFRPNIPAAGIRLQRHGRHDG